MTAAIAKEFAESEFEKYRVVQTGSFSQILIDCLTALIMIKSKEMFES